MFPHTVTIWNQVSKNHTGGATYQRTILKDVRYEITVAKTPKKEGEENTSVLNLYIFLDKVIAASYYDGGNSDTDYQNSSNLDAGYASSTYVDPILFGKEESKERFFTFDKNTYVGLGKIETDIPSENCFLISDIKPVYAMGNTIHHFEIIGS